MSSLVSRELQQLRERASQEYDSQKLIELVQRITELIDKHNGGKMKYSTSSIRRACIALAGALFIAAGAIAFVAVKTSTSTSHATSTSQAKQSMSHFRALEEALETSLG